MKLTLAGSSDYKKFILLQALKEEAHKQLSYYRQKQDDLVARMATEWPIWGCTLDFYTHMILPLLRNSFILNFINLSEGFSLKDIEIKSGYYRSDKSGESGELKFITERLDLSSGDGSENPVPPKQADLVDFALYLLKNVTDISVKNESQDITVSEILKEWKVDFDREALLVRIRDADIGAQAFFALLEGIMRNASKHGKDLEVSESLPPHAQSTQALKDVLKGVRYEQGKLIVTDELTEESKDEVCAALEAPEYRDALNRLFTKIAPYRHEKRFRVKIVHCESWGAVNKFVDMDERRVTPSDRHGYVIISISRDLIKDPLTMEVRQIAQEPMVKYVNDRLGEEIIDETGQINPGNWGLKEIKTCAAFLGGENLYAVNEKDPQYVMVGKTRANVAGGIWEDGTERLCFIIRIEKPRLAIALVPEAKHPNDPDQWKGVQFISREGEIFEETVDYDFIYIDESLKDQVDGFLDLHWQVLPQRLVYGNFSFQTGGENKDISLAENFSSVLYDCTISTYIDNLDKGGVETGEERKNEALKLRIYFEDDAAARRWKESLGDQLVLRNGKRVILDFLESGLNKQKTSKFDKDYKEGYQIAIFRHTNLQQGGVVDEIRGIPPKPGYYKYYPYYAQQVSGADPFFSFLLSIKPEQDTALANLVLRQIVESCLLNILIVDERIAQSLDGLRAKDEPDISHSEKLYWMGINVAGSIEVDGTQIWNAKHVDDKLVKVSINKDGSITTPGENRLPINILLIHATRLNEIFDRLRASGWEKSKESFIQKLQETIDCVVVHSGRGKTEGDIPESTPFLEYSTVEKYVLSEPSKFYLVQIALNVKGEETKKSE